MTKILHKKIPVFIGYALLLLLIGFYSYSSLFPPDVDQLLKQAQSSSEDAQRNAEELLKEGHENKPIAQGNSSPETSNPEKRENGSNRQQSLVWLQTGFSGLLVALGFILIYIAVFLYEDEEGKIQNKLENTWIKISDAQKLSISKNLSFLRVAAKICGNVFDFFFGQKRMSVQSLGVSVCFALTSVNIVFYKYSSSTDLDNSILSAFFWLLLGIVPSLASGRIPKLIWFVFILYVIWYDFILGNMALGLIAIGFGTPDMAFVIFSFLVSVILSCLLCFGSIQMIRTVVRRISMADSLWKASVLLLPVALPVLVQYILWLTLLYLPTSRREILNSCLLILVFAVLCINLSLLIPAAISVIISVASVIHKVVWMLLERPVYSLQRLNIARRSKLLGLVGSLMIGAGVGGWNWAEKIIDKASPF